MHFLLVLLMFVGVCVCFFQVLSIGKDALFIGAPNVCRGFVSVSCNDSLLV